MLSHKVEKIALHVVSYLTLPVLNFDFYIEFNIKPWFLKRVEILSSVTENRYFSPSSVPILKYHFTNALVIVELTKPGRRFYSRRQCISASHGVLSRYWKIDGIERMLFGKVKALCPFRYCIA